MCPEQFEITAPTDWEAFERNATCKRRASEPVRIEQQFRDGYRVPMFHVEVPDYVLAFRH